MASVGSPSSSTTSSGVKVVDSNKTGFNGLTSEDFLQLLITQLQNQDPSAPMSNEEMLSQISQMRSLQSDLELSDTLKTTTLGQQLAASTSFIGKTVTGTTDDNTSVSGTVDRVYVAGGVPYLQIGTSNVAISNVSEVK